MIKFYLITGILFALAAGGGFYLGWNEGRNEFANECITIGNFIVWDYGQDKNRRFDCTEAPVESKLPANDNKLKL